MGMIFLEKKTLIIMENDRTHFGKCFLSLSCINVTFDLHHFSMIMDITQSNVVTALLRCSHRWVFLSPSIDEVTHQHHHCDGRFLDLSIKYFFRFAFFFDILLLDRILM